VLARSNPKNVAKKRSYVPAALIKTETKFKKEVLSHPIKIQLDKFNPYKGNVEEWISQFEKEMSRIDEQVEDRGYSAGKKFVPQSISIY
jgi:hypothetical protein